MKKNYSNKTILWIVCVLFSIFCQATIADSLKTKAYTLAYQVSPNSLTEPLIIDVPVDSAIVGVSISANPRNISYCYARLEYSNASLRPDHSNTNMIASAEIPFIGNGSINSGETTYIPVNNMFVGKGDNLEFKTGFGGGNTASNSSVSAGCTLKIVVYLTPLNPGVKHDPGKLATRN